MPFFIMYKDYIDNYDRAAAAVADLMASRAGDQQGGESSANRRGSQRRLSLQAGGGSGALGGTSPSSRRGSFVPPALRRATGDEASNQSTFLSLLIKPVQQIPRYRLIMERLDHEVQKYVHRQQQQGSGQAEGEDVDGEALLIGGDSGDDLVAVSSSPSSPSASTSSPPAEYPDALHISLAAQVIADVASDVNESLKQKEALTRVAEIQACFLPAQVRELERLASGCVG